MIEPAADIADKTLRVLLLEGSAADAERIDRSLCQAGIVHVTRRVTNCDLLPEELSEFAPQLLLLDVASANRQCMDVLLHVRQNHSEMSVVVIGNSLDGEFTADLMHAGVEDVVLKHHLDRLPSIIERVVAEQHPSAERNQVEQALNETEARFRTLLDASPDAMVVVDADGRIVLVSRQVERLFGYRRDELIGKQVEQLIPERYRHMHVGHRKAYQARPKARPMGTSLELSGRRKDGSEFPVDINLSPVRTGAGVETIAAIRDITGRKEREEEVERLTRVRSMMFAINSVIIRVRDRDTLYRDACRIAVEQGGFRLAWIGLLDADGAVRPAASYGVDEGYIEQAGISVRENGARGQGPSGRALRSRLPFVSNDIATDATMAPWRQAALARGYRSAGAFPLIVDNEVVGTLNLYAPETGAFDSQEVRLLTELAADISIALESIGHRETIDYLAYYDPVTHLGNRNLLTQRLEAMIDAAGSADELLALLMLDIERFKSINDALGQQAGDALLRDLATRLVEEAESAEHVARVGGDVFALVVSGLGRLEELSGLISERLPSALSRPFSVAGEELRPGIRMGIALFPNDGEEAATLFRNAEVALKKAKTGPNRYEFYAARMNRTVRRRVQLETQLRTALENGDFTLHYQPKIDLANGRISGAEALLRWPQNSHDNMPPDRIIAMLEEMGGLAELGEWTYQRVAADRAGWRAAGLKAPPVAVNVSAVELLRPEFVDAIAALIDQDIDRGGIELEITESGLMRDLGMSLRRLQRLDELGVPIAIDDFGTGYSSLSYLLQLPVRALKIDKSFVMGMIDSPDAMNIVSTIITLAHSMGLRVIAEGVETQGELDALRDLDCDEIQGFIYSRALSAEDFAALLRDPPRLD